MLVAVSLLISRRHVALCAVIIVRGGHGGVGFLQISKISNLRHQTRSYQQIGGLQVTVPNLLLMQHLHRQTRLAEKPQAQHQEQLRHLSRLHRRRCGVEQGVMDNAADGAKRSLHDQALAQMVSADFNRLANTICAEHIRMLRLHLIVILTLDVERVRHLHGQRATSATRPLAVVNLSLRVREFGLGENSDSIRFDVIGHKGSLRIVGQMNGQHPLLAGAHQRLAKLL